MNDKGFMITLPNGIKLQFSTPIFNKKQKSYDFIVNNGKDNNYYKVGIIRDIDTLREMFFNESEENE